MSGGYFNYDQFRIGHIAHEIQNLIDSNKSKDLNSFGNQIGREYTLEVINELRNAVNHLYIAQVYANHINWLISNEIAMKQPELTE